MPELSQTAGSVPMTSGTERSKPNGEIKQFSSKHVRQGRRAEKAVWRTPAPFHFSVAVAELCDREAENNYGTESEPDVRRPQLNADEIRVRAEARR